MKNFSINHFVAASIATVALQSSAEAQGQQFQHWTSGRTDNACYIANQASISSGTLRVFIADFSGGDGRQVQVQANISMDETVRPVIIVDGVSFQAARVVQREDAEDFARFSPSDTTRIVAAMRAGNQMTVRVYSNQREYSANMSLAGVTAATNHMERSCGTSQARSAQSTVARENTSVASTRSGDVTRTLLEGGDVNYWSCEYVDHSSSSRTGVFWMRINGANNVVLYPTSRGTSFMSDFVGSSSGNVCEYPRRTGNVAHVFGRCVVEPQQVVIGFQRRIFFEGSGNGGDLASEIVGRLQRDGTLSIHGEWSIGPLERTFSGQCERS